MMGHRRLARPSVVGGRRRRPAPPARRQGPLRPGHRRRSATTAATTSRSVGAQGSHQLAATALANALAVLPDGDGVAAGGDVDVLLLLDWP